MDIDAWLSVISALAQFSLAILGGVVSLKPDLAKQHGWKLLFAFVVLGLCGVSVTIVQSRRNSASQAKLNDTLHNLQDNQRALASAQGELSAKGQQIVDLQNNTLRQSRIIASLSKQNIDTAMGGESFCYMIFEGGSLDQGKPIPWFNHVGKYPVYDVEVRIVDVRTLREIMSRQGARRLSFNAIGPAQGTIRLGNLAVGSSRLMPSTTVTFSGKKGQHFNVFYSARNGFWQQVLRLSLVNGKWLMATKVLHGEDKEEREVFTSIDPEYPRMANGLVDWDSLPEN